MKRLIAVVPMLLLTTVLSIDARAAYEPEVDYSQIMIEAAAAGDYEAGRRAELSRNEKIDETGSDAAKIKFDELMLLSKIMYAEAGSNWLSDDWKMCVGEVVLNRAASPEFPNSIAEVLSQPGQYYGPNSRYFNNLRPTARCANLALRLLNGERVMNDPSVVFQANFRQGSGTHTACYDRYLGWTYFCISSRPELYEGVFAADDIIDEPVIETAATPDENAAEETQTTPEEQIPVEQPENLPEIREEKPQPPIIEELKGDYRDYILEYKY